MSCKYLRVIFFMSRNCHCERIHLADLIDQYDSSVNFSCNFCYSLFSLCVVMKLKSSWCFACVCQNRACEKRMFTDKKWNDFRKEKANMTSSLVTRNFDLSLLQCEINCLQQHLSAVHEAIIKKLDEHSQLWKHHLLLKEHDRFMLQHDSLILNLSLFSNSSLLTDLMINVMMTENLFFFENVSSSSEFSLSDS
jgi:hypothetical protein